MRHRLPSERRRGSASLAAMVICLLGTIGLLAMVTIIHARQMLINSGEEKALRRVRLLNGRQLAKEALFRRVLASESGAETTLALGGNWGRVTIPAWNSNPYTTNQLSSITNQTSPSPELAPYVTSLTASIYTVVDASSNWSDPDSFICNFNAQNTALAGFLLDARRPADSLAANSVAGTLVVNGRALAFENPEQNNAFEFQSTTISAPNSALERSNFAPTCPSRPLNFPMLPLPEGVAAVAGYVKGDRSAVDAADTAAAELAEIVQAEGQTILAENVTHANGIDSDGSGVVNLTVGDFGLVHTIIQGNLTTLNLIGQPNAVDAVAVENLAPVIVITNSTSLTTVTFTALNRRPLILANAVGEANSALAVSYAFPSGADFRVFFIQQDANTQFTLSGPATIRGGIALDFATSVSGGTLTIEEETNKSFFQFLLPRSAWLETYRQL